ncbi:MAG: flagellar M-ring protein FliF [Chthonomonas sp.]|nr:flagellar M-ring protein FliF [Chthonomonas sp.]
MAALLLRLRTWWETADRTQKVVTIFGSLLLVVILGATVFFAGRPKMEVLFRDLSPQEQASVVDELTKAGIQLEYDRSGLVSVPSNKIAEAQAKLASSGKLPTSGHLGTSELANIGPMGSDAVTQRRLLAIQEGQIASSVEQIQGVQQAEVHVTLGESSPFARSESAASASVILTESANNPISAEAASAIKNLVVRAVDRLDAKNVSIITNTGRTLFDGAEQESGQGLASARLVAESTESRRRERSLQQRLDAILGPGNAIVSVPVLEMNFDTKTEEKVERNPSEGPIAVETAKESMNGSGSASTGVAGAPSNLPEAANGAGARTDSYGNEVTSKSWEINETKTKTEKATGNLTKLAYNVVVNTDKVKNLDTVKEAVRAELGPFAQDSTNFTFNVTGMAFDKTVTEAAAKSTAASASAAKMQQMMSLLPVGALLLVGFMVVRAISKASRAQNVLVAASAGGSMQQLELGSPTHALIPGDQEQHLYTDPETGEQRVISPMEAQSLPAGTNTTVIRGTGSTEMVLERATADELQIEAIPDRLNLPLEQLRRFSVEKPDKVALLLKSWVLEDGR